jgi:hypothetical protein
MNKPLWHRPRIVTVEQWGPFRAFVMLTLFDNRTVIVPQTPTVVNSSDEEAKARQREQNRRYKAEQRKRDAEAVDEAKQYNKKNKNRRKEPDKFRAVTVRLRKSERDQLLANVKLGQPDDDLPVTGKELRRIEAEAATAAVRLGLKK